MGSESIAHETEVKSKLVGQKNTETKHLFLVKARLLSFFATKTNYKYGRRFLLLVGYNI